MHAYVYQESSGKKGANNVVSFLLHYIQTNIISVSHNCPQQKDELNVIMDNCGGQNKNGLVLRAAAMMMERGWFKRVNMIFLVKGRTQNSADRMFNLLKIHFWQTNVYSFEQALDILNECEYVVLNKINLW